MTPQHTDDDLGIAPDPYADRDDHEYVPDEYDDRPTRKQLAYLRSLANRAGQTFAYPRTAAQASREIRRLKAQQPSTRLERALERREISDAIARGPEGGAAIAERNTTTGYGSTATWR